MGTLPQAADYGPRVRLSSSRVDIPGQGEMAVANALERAAGTFAAAMIDHKEKDDALSYSNAKSEYLIADIIEREKLADDQDWATHDERYRTAMTGHYDRLFPTVKSQRDRLLFDVEARLMNERGSVAVGDNSRTKEIDWNVGQWKKNGIAAQSVIMTASDAQTAQDAMFTFLAQGNALRKKGYISEEELTTSTQGFVTETAFKRLMSMDPKEREMLLERSVTMTKTKGEPITRDQIAAGEGSGSIADFLPLDERVAMLEATRKGNDHDDTERAAFGVWDQIRSIHQDPNKVDEAVRQASKNLDPDVRTRLATMSRQYRQDTDSLKTTRQATILNAGSQMIGMDENPEGMNGQDWMALNESQKQSLKDAWNLKQTNREFAEFTIVTRGFNADGTRKAGMSWQIWKQIPREQRASVTLDSPEWKTVLTGDDWRALVREQDQIKKEQESGAPPAQAPGMTNTQMVTSALVRTGFIPQIGRETEDSEAFQRLAYELDRATQAAQDVKGSKLTNTERDKVLADLLVPMAFTDDYGGWFGWDKADVGEKQMVPVNAMSAKQRKTARYPWKGAMEEVASTSSAGISSTYAMEIELMATNMKPPATPNQAAKERAYFAMKEDMGLDEVKRRLRDE